MSSHDNNEHSGGHGHDAPLSGEVFVTPPPWRPKVNYWTPRVYTGPLRERPDGLIPVDPSIADTASAIAARRKGPFGSFTEPGSDAPRRRARR